MTANSVQELTPYQTIPSCKQGALRAVRYNVDGEFILTCGGDRTIKLWSPAKGKQLANYQGHSGDVLDVCGSCDNSQLTSGGTDKNVFLWDVSESRLIRRWFGHQSAVTTVVFNENSNVIVSGSQDNTVKIWDVRAGRSQQRELQSLEEGKDTVTSLAVTNDSILVGCADGYTYLYDLRNGRMSTDCLNEAVTSVNISRDMASHLVSVADETVKLIDRESGELLATYKGHSEKRFKDYKIEVAFDFKDQVVMAASPKGKVYLWDLINENVKGICKINDSNIHPVTSISSHPQRAEVTAAVGGGIYFFELEELIGTDGGKSSVMAVQQK